MSPVTIAAVTIVHLALAAYTVGVVKEQRSRRVTASALRFLRAGVVFDVVATALMVVASTSGPFTLHGLLGFSALAAMVSETVLAWRHRARYGDDLVPAWLHTYSRFAYAWWLVAYVTGAYLVMSGRG
jgi:uncharacterized repeat protein (TIGR03987 family)